MNANGAAGAPQFAQRTLSGPMPSTTVASSSRPHAAHTLAQNGSPLKRPSIMRSLPDAVASDVTEMSRMWMRDRVADLRPLDLDRQRHLVAALDRRA